MGFHGMEAAPLEVPKEASLKPDMSLHNPSLEGSQKDELQREGWENQTHSKVEGKTI